ncbi:MAG: signal peptidase I [Gammaproteobacteria bacterium]|nr:MAG: signal peptidase I [Gammaproteobacteria bacterium]
MSINLALILTLLTAFSGAVVAYDKFYLRKRSSDSGGQTNAALSTVIDYSRSFFPVLLFVLVIRSFIFEPFRIPSGSMMPTLLQGDYIFVKKYSFGLRLPVIDKKIIETGEPERGDVVVFRLPSKPSINYIKRVIGLPGDELVYEGHRLTVNGELIEVTKDADDPVTSAGARYIEQLGDRKHAILVTNPRNVTRDGRYTVPDGHYFVMGDNRDNSRDSRFIGAIPETHLVGEAVRIWMHMDGIEWPEWARIGTKIE